MIALFKFFPLDLLVGKGLDYADACQRILETGIHISDLPAVFHKCLLHPLVLAEGEDEHTENQYDEGKGKSPVDQEEKDKGAGDLYHGDEQIFRAVVRKLSDVKQVGHELAHHLTGIVPAVIGERQLFIVVKQLLAHIPLHVGAHHVSLVAHIIFAQALDDVHDQKSCREERQSAQDGSAVLCEKRVCHSAQDLRISQIH